MTQLALNNPFGFNFSEKKKKFQQTNKSRYLEEVIPSQPNFPGYKDSGYYLDSISRIAKNQSLTPEQIAESRIKATTEEIASLLQKYEITEVEQVKNFLLRNRLLISLLEEIPNKIFQYFGNNQRLVLKMSYESDSPNSSELWVEIMTALSGKEALSLLDKFDQEWWLENMDRAYCKLNITLKFI